MSLFKYKQKMMIHILLDKETLPHKYNVKSHLSKLDGVKESFFTENSDISDIAVLAEWNESEIEQKISEIRKIPNVSSVEYNIFIPA